jgi:hypothetical protein
LDAPIAPKRAIGGLILLAGLCGILMGLAQCGVAPDGDIDAGSFTGIAERYASAKLIFASAILIGIGCYLRQPRYRQ